LFTDLEVEIAIGFGEYLANVLEKTEKLLSNCLQVLIYEHLRKKRFAKRSGQKALKNGCLVILRGQVTVCLNEETIEDI